MLRTDRFFLRMKYTDFHMCEAGFAGHMAEPEEKASQAVLVIMGGEKSILPGIKIAERFAEYGFCALAVSLFGAAGLPEGADRIPLDKKWGTGHYEMMELSWGKEQVQFSQPSFPANYRKCFGVYLLRTGADSDLIAKRENYVDYIVNLYCLKFF